MSYFSRRTSSNSSAGAASDTVVVSSRRTSAIPNIDGDKALYTVTVQSPDNNVFAETRLLDMRKNTSTVFSNRACDREVRWLGIDNQVVWLRDVDHAATEIWISDAAGPSQASHCAGRIGGPATHLKVQRLRNEYDDIAIAVASPTYPNGSLYSFSAEDARADSEIFNAIFYTTLRKKAYTNDSTKTRYTLSPSKWANALRGTGLASPLAFPHGSFEDFDISSSGIVFLSQDTLGGSINFPSINLYYIPLKTFTEVSRPRPQIIRVKDYDGRSSNPVFSPNGGSVAFLKKKHPIDRNDRNRIIVINNIRDFRAHMSMDDMPTQESEKDWHLSPFSVAWSDNGKELYVVAVDQGIRRLFKIPAALSSIKKEPEPITSESTTPADVRHMRMVFSAPMEASR